ncbi:MAG: hypothetical protein GF405_04135, partial [Candidatus Eisenbacteria bacterium]|nr:hypothetical protein [Candidatus Eisenbacteria bacterium]
MKNTPLVLLAAGMMLLAAVSGAFAKDLDTDLVSRVPNPSRLSSASAVETRGARLDTLWIFDADFSDLTGDNAGWTAFDRSGTLGQENYWHHDTIRINGFTHLGDSTWWCGTENPCWRQPRGYGNDWIQILEREFTEMATATGGVTLEWDQRIAMEHDYDYGYVDVSDDGGATWTNLYWVSNPGFSGKPGSSKDWDDPTYGHVTLDLTSYAGSTIDLRFRFESDVAYSSQDQFNNPPQESVKDGAWQLDNITITDDTGVIFLDDAESGNMGWVHDDLPTTGQTGVTFWRGLYGTDFVTGRGFTCESRTGWMYAAVDPFTGTMVDGQYSWLMSPPIDVSGAAKLVGEWDQWIDFPRPANDIFNLYLASNDLQACVTDPSGFVDEDPGWWYGGPFWGTWVDDWDAFAGNDWLAVLWAQQNDEAPLDQHRAGLFLARQRVGIPSGDAGTVFERDTWNSFNDWFVEDLSDALLDTGRINIKDDDDIATAYVVATNDGGTTWESYSCRREDPASNWWFTPPPANQMTQGSEIFYYYEATDGIGNTARYPSDAPDRVFEMTILPVEGSVANPGMLLVDKHGRATPGESRYEDIYHTSEYYYREMLEILGYEYDTYDVEVPSGSTDQSDGPDTAGMKYYNTQIWFTNEFDSYTIKKPDQVNLISWLNESGGGAERNLLITGNDVGKELMGTAVETLSFYETWLASDYVDNSIGVVTVDSVPGLQDHAGDFTFMDYDDGECIVRGGCPTLNYFDVLQPFSGITGTEIVADYIKTDASTRPAGVAYTHQTLGYQTVNLGFGMEFMMDGYEANGYYTTGIADRA